MIRRRKSATEELILKRQHLARANAKLTDLTIEDEPGLRIWTPELNLIELTSRSPVLRTEKFGTPHAT
jgi:hypothetical protein